jgi:hypothetical protein
MIRYAIKETLEGSFVCAEKTGETDVKGTEELSEYHRLRT